MYYTKEYRRLENIVGYSSNYISIKKENYMIEAVAAENIIRPYYGSFNIRDGYNIDNDFGYVRNSRNVTYIFEPEIFLKANRPITNFINATEEVKALVEETFRALTGKELQNIIIKVCSEEELRKLHSNWNRGILGFSINNGIIANQIFVKNGFLDRLLITIGHEIGHVFTPALRNKHDEEAKAFAFEFAWVKAIKENNIGNLGNCLRRGMPAQNGLHNIAFNFVLELVNKGKDALELHWNLVNGYYFVDSFKNIQ